MHSPKEESINNMENIQKKLSELAEVLGDISSRMKKIADHRRGGLMELEQASQQGSQVDLLSLLGEKPDTEDINEDICIAESVARKPVSMDWTSGVPKFRYAQYVEFSSLEEFLKFKNLPVIQADEIAGVDWEDLEKRLAG